MKIKYYLFVFLIYFIPSLSNANENFFDKAIKLFEENEYNKSKFLFQRNIVFNPKHAKSYLYLAKIYNLEENEIEELKNLKTTLLLDPENEEAMYMLIEIELEKSNFSKVQDLTKKFNIICSKFCNKKQTIEQKLNDIQAKQENN